MGDSEGQSNTYECIAPDNCTEPEYESWWSAELEARFENSAFDSGPYPEIEVED